MHPSPGKPIIWSRSGHPWFLSPLRTELRPPGSQSSIFPGGGTDLELSSAYILGESWLTSKDVLSTLNWPLRISALPSSWWRKPRIVFHLLPKAQFQQIRLLKNGLKDMQTLHSSTFYPSIRPEELLPGTPENHFHWAMSYLSTE